MRRSKRQLAAGLPKIRCRAAPAQSHARLTASTFSPGVRPSPPRRRQPQRRATKIHPVFALGEERRMEEYIRNAGGRCGQRIRDDRQYHRTRASAQRRRSKTNGEDQAIRRSKGGLSTKIHAMVDALGNPLAFFLTAGQAHDLQRCRRVSTPDAGRHLVGRCR
jgi:hypothetical protein